MMELLLFLLGTQWTVMVYLNADNNLETYGIKDFNEMEVVGSSPDVNIVVQIDRAIGYNNSNGDWTTCRRYYVIHDNDINTINSQLLEDLGEVDMGDPTTLSNFALWAMNNFPANHYLLIIWNHGDGWRGIGDSMVPVRGVSYDESSGNEISVSRGELKQALFQIGHVDVLGFDACLMQMWEVMVNASPYATCMVGSEETEPADGWYYTGFLDDLVTNSSMNAVELATSIVSSTEQPTLSAVDLSIINTLNHSIDTFALELMRAKDQGYTNTINSVRSATQNFYEYYHIDLYDFARRIKLANVPDYLKNTADMVMNSVNDVVKASNNNYANAYGISIYHPTKPSYYDNSYSNLEVCEFTKWDEYLKGYMYNDSMGIYGGINNWTFIDTIKYDGAPYSFWGYPDEPPFYAGVRFSFAQPCTLTGILAFFNHEFNYQIYIYDTDEYLMPKNIIYSQSGISHHCWNYIELASPLAIEQKRDLWLVVYTENAYYPIGVDNGNWSAHRSYVSLNGNDWEEALDNGTCYNFNIRAEVKYFELTEITEISNPQFENDNLKLRVFPNPFRNQCVFHYALSTMHYAENVGQGFGLAIYDITGRLVKQFNHLTDYQSSILWDGTDNLGRRLPAGIYFVEMSLGTKQVSKKVIKIK